MAELRPSETCLILAMMSEGKGSPS